MKLTAPQPALRANLRMVMPAVPGKSSMPVLSGVLITVNDAFVRYAATNLAIGITHSAINHVAVEPGAVVVPAKLLLDTVSAMPSNSDVTIEHIGQQRVRVSSGRSAVTIAGYDAEEFPAIPVADGTTVSMPLKMLQSMINATAYAAASDESRPVLAGVHLKSAPGAVTMAAADGFRLAMARYAWHDAAILDLIIPAQSLVELGKIQAAADAMVNITVNPGGQQVVFDLGGTTIVSRLVEGRFPDVDRIEPTGAARDNGTRMMVSVAALKDALKLTKPFGVETMQHLRLLAENNTLTLSTPNHDSGQANVDVPVQLSGPQGKVNLNQLYLADLLGTVPVDELTMEIVSSTAPFLTRYVLHGIEVKNIIMPMSERK